MPAPVGNQNARRAKIWRDAINDALNVYESENVKKGQALDQIAKVLIEQALEAEPFAIKEIGDRLDGKSTQMVGEDEEAPFSFNVSITGIKSQQSHSDQAGTSSARRPTGRTSNSGSFPAQPRITPCTLKYASMTVSSLICRWRRAIGKTRIYASCLP